MPPACSSNVRKPWCVGIGDLALAFGTRLHMQVILRPLSAMHNGVMSRTAVKLATGSQMCKGAAARAFMLFNELFVRHITQELSDM